MHTSADDSVQSVVIDIENHRRTGAPALGHLAGLHRTGASDNDFALGLTRSRPMLAGGAGIVEIAMLADLALGGVLRDRIGLTVPMPTISMTLQVHPGQLSRITEAHGEVTALADRTACSRARLQTSDGAVLGDAQGLFALPVLPYDGPGRLMPWDTWLQEHLDDGADDTRAVPPSNADSQFDADCLAHDIAAHASSNLSEAWGTRHVRAQMTESGPGVAMMPTATMTNRLGHIQGGVLLAVAVIAAELDGEFAVENLTTASIDFLDAAQADAPIQVVVSVLRQSGRSLFVSILLSQRDRTCCHVSAVFRR